MARVGGGATDREELADLAARYARCIDAGDLEGVLSCFTEDAEAEYGATRLHGSEDLRRFFVAAFEALVGPRHPSTHLLGGVEIELDGDTARTETTAVAFLTREPDLLLLRGLRYSDELVRREDGWRIARRRHRSLWQAELPRARPAAQ